MSVMNHLNTTATLIDFLIGKLETSTSWTTCFYTGDRLTHMTYQIPDFRLPAAVVWYGSGSFGDNPRRRIQLSVVVCVDASDPNAWRTLATLCDSVITLVDGQTTGDAHFHLESEEPATTDLGFTSRQLIFAVDDH